MSEQGDILFRGKEKDYCEWVEGYVYEQYPPHDRYANPNDESKWYILKTGFIGWNIPGKIEMYEIDPSTICQYTGRTDKNGKRIFDGDILRNNNGLTGRVIYMPEHCAFMIYVPRENRYCYLWDNNFSRIEVIGNVHDNPELLEGGQP